MKTLLESIEVLNGEPAERKVPERDFRIAVSNFNDKDDKVS